MRRSKSDPAKYARNYRKISQRRMTQYDHIDEEKEIERLRSVLRNSEEHLRKDEEASSEKRQKNSSGKHDVIQNLNWEADSSMLSNELSIELSSELLVESGNTSAENPLVVLPSKKKKKKEKTVVQLTHEEIREAKSLQKKTARKLQQLETRAAQKKKRAELYKKLEQNKISKEALQLLQSSGKVSRKDTDTKKQTLQKLLNKERAGIKLNQEENDLLYPEKVVEDLPDNPLTLPNATVHSDDCKEAGNSKKKRKRNQEKVKDDNIRDLEKTYEKVGPRKEKSDEESTSGGEEEMECDVPPESKISSKSSLTTAQSTNNGQENKKIATASQKQEPQSGFDFATQMMASLSKLKSETRKKAEEVPTPANDIEEEERKNARPHKQYVPSEPTVLKTAATLGIRGAQLDAKRKVMPIKRPEPVENSRYDLPVSAMEFEIMDAIRNNDVTILCGETGSGKSTQVPQFLYEGGFSVNNSKPDAPPFLIGITQPRRVAAVSTAKRVCYEMGRGDGQSIKGSSNLGNLVAYRTRYETAGAGKETCVQFMTDGILLQEIQSDLLLRRYSVVVLDESHERNLNTDVLIGLLSVALPLRKKAAEEDPSIVPLKIVLMSATLRVEDFTKNEKLFPSCAPAVVTVQGRTHPVTIHHSKVTELEDYETIAYKKICKIHRKLPQGGILVFLTGKKEIVRMVNRLRRALNGKTKVKQSRCTGSGDVTMPNFCIGDDSGPRELDDEELDADDVADDYEEFEEDDGDVEPEQTSETDDNLPEHAYILPLYSLLSADEQAKVFAPVPEGHRLIVIATNIAETSITIPGISYVVDTGRQKCRNYSSGTGVASYDVMWISKAAADQRAGRAGRTGPGHCYRLYSSSLYARHMDPFALPEVLTRPLEDVVLAMKALEISNVASFPFPTPPNRGQIDAAVKLLANIGCVDVSNVEKGGGDGTVTRLGRAVAKLPLGVRYAKMLLVAAQAGVLDYAIVVVSVLSEVSPFQYGHTEGPSAEDEEEKEKDEDEGSLNEIDQQQLEEIEKQKKKRNRWLHRSGDILAAMLAVGAFTYAGRDAGGVSEQLASRKFCEENGLNYVVMTRIQKMRSHLASVAKNRLGNAGGVAVKTGGYSSKMSPPNKLQERLLVQAIASGLLDNVALLAPPGSISGEHPFSLRSAYLTCSSSLKEPLFLDRNSAVFNRDFRQLPQWVCYDSMVRKSASDGTPVTVMRTITPIDPSWLGELASGTKLLSIGAPLLSPRPSYDEEKDAVVCAVSTKFGSHGWEIPPVKRTMFESLHTPEGKHSPHYLLDDSFRWFAKFLLEGKVFPELKGFQKILSDSPAIITKKAPVAKVSVLVSELSSAGVDSGSALRKHWAEKDDKFLFKALKRWIKCEHHSEAKKIWIEMVKRNVKIWKEIR